MLDLARVLPSVYVRLDDLDYTRLLNNTIRKDRTGKGV